jgi:hypothetical protein
MLAFTDYLQPPVVKRLYDEHVASRADHGMKLWTLLTIEVWLRSLAARDCKKETCEARVYG